MKDLPNGSDLEFTVSQVCRQRIPRQPRPYDCRKLAAKPEPRSILMLNADGVRKFEPRVASTLGTCHRNRINSEGVGERFQR
jgi:hypothetical protein